MTAMQLFIGSLIITFGAFAWKCVYRYRNRYVGFGWVLDYKDGSVIVVTRLVDSPAGQGKLGPGDQIVAWGDTAMSFASGPEMITFVNNALRGLKVGDHVLFRVKRKGADDEEEISLEASIIQGPIPVYNTSAFIPEGEEWRWRRGMVYCPRTGMYVPTIRLSEEAIKAVFG